MPDHWTAADGRLLKDLREDTGQDRASFARRCTLSAAQLAELEDGGHGRFYSERIKAHTGQRLLRKLGHHVLPERLSEPEPTLERTLDPAPEPPPAPLVLPKTEVPSLPQPPVRRRARRLIATGLAVAVAGTIGIALAPGLSGPSRQSTEAVSVAVAATTEPVPVLPASSPSAPDAAAMALQPAASAAATQAAASQGRCNWPPADTLAHYTPPSAFRPDNYVYVEAVTPASVCVIDGQNRQTLAQVKPGDGVSVYGEAPFTVQTRQWSDLRVFFQGIRVNLESAVTPQAVVLNAH